MFAGCALVLIANCAFVSEVPELVREKLECTNEVAGTFTQTKKDGRSGLVYMTKGEYRVRPGRDFEWRTREPFETVFYATPTEYVYSNEDERVEKKLADLPRSSYFADLGKGNFSIFFRLFDALYKEDGGRFFVKAKPKAGSELEQFLKRVEAEGNRNRWTLTAVFPDDTEFKLEFVDRLREEVSHALQ